MSVWSSRTMHLPGRDPDTYRRTGQSWVVDVATAPAFEPYVRLAIWPEGSTDEDDLCLYLTPSEAQNLAELLGVAGLAVMAQGDPQT